MSYQDEFDNIRAKLEQTARETFDERLGWDHMGPRIQNVLNQKKRRRALFWWWLHGGLLLVLILTTVGERGSDNTLKIKPVVPIASQSYEAIPEGIDKEANPLLDVLSNPITREWPTAASTVNSHNPRWTSTPILPGLSPKILSPPVQVQRFAWGPGLFIPARTEGLPAPDYPWLPLAVQNPKPENHSGTWLISLAGGLNTLSENNPNTFPSSMETPLIGWETSLRVQHVRPSGWTWHLGVAYQDLKYRSNWEGTTNVQLYRPNTVDTIFINAATGAETYTYRDSIPGTRSRRFQQHNSHQSLSVHLLGGYSWTLNRLGVQVQGGPDVQLWRRVEGKSVLGPDDIRDLNTIYHTNPSLAIRLETQLNYEFAESWQLLLRGGWSKSVTDWSVPELNLDRRPSVWSMQLGIQHTLEP